MAPIASGHAGIVNGLNRHLVLAVGEQAVVAVQNPVRLDNHNEPQPDFALLQPREDFYRGALPARRRAAADRGGPEQPELRPQSETRAVCAIWHPGSLDRRCHGGRGGSLALA